MPGTPAAGNQKRKRTRQQRDSHPGLKDASDPEELLREPLKRPRMTKSAPEEEEATGPELLTGQVAIAFPREPQKSFMAVVVDPVLQPASDSPQLTPSEESNTGQAGPPKCFKIRRMGTKTISEISGSELIPYLPLRPVAPSASPLLPAEPNPKQPGSQARIGSPLFPHSAEDTNSLVQILSLLDTKKALVDHLRLLHEHAIGISCLPRPLSRHPSFLHQYAWILNQLRYASKKLSDHLKALRRRQLAAQRAESLTQTGSAPLHQVRGRLSQTSVSLLPGQVSQLVEEWRTQAEEIVASSMQVIFQIHFSRLPSSSHNKEGNHSHISTFGLLLFFVHSFRCGVSGWRRRRLAPRPRRHSSLSKAASPWPWQLATPSDSNYPSCSTNSSSRTYSQPPHPPLKLSDTNYPNSGCGCKGDTSRVCVRNKIRLHFLFARCGLRSSNSAGSCSYLASAPSEGRSSNTALSIRDSGDPFFFSQSFMSETLVSRPYSSPVTDPSRLFWTNPLSWSSSARSTVCFLNQTF